MNDSAIDYDDVQGTILRGYRVDLARHFVLNLTDARRAGKLIAALVAGSGELPRITTASRIEPKPPCFTNISFTSTGLAALGVSDAQLATFDTSFQKGAADPAVAANVGDIGSSAPATWLGGLGDGAVPRTGDPAHRL